MKTFLQPEQLKPLFTGIKKGLVYTEATNLYHKLRIHADGEAPIHLIKEARPNESEEVRKYRVRIYEPETVNPIERVMGVLEKIRRSPDWMMRFEDELPSIITPEESLEQYLTANYPVYGNFENWLFEEALKNACIDACAVIIIIPNKFNLAYNEFSQPVATIFNSNKIVDFVPEDYCVVKTDELSSLLSPELQQNRLLAAQQTLNVTTTAQSQLFETFTPGQVYYHVNTLEYQKWEENAEGKYVLTQKFVHNLGKLPVFQMPGKFLKRIGPNILKKSPLYAMVPHLNKAAREGNDLDAGVIKHLHLQKWRINNTPCNTCNGKGKVPGATTPITCSSCKGTGLSTGNSPFDEIIVKPGGLGEAAIPTPPVGYVQLDPEILRLQNERVKEHIYRALEAVNMEHLADVQLNQSGIAKSVDRDEATTLVYLFASYLSSIANEAIYWINELRYNQLVSVEDRKSMLPIIPVPEKFDVINSSFLLTEYKSAKDAGLNATILAEMQKEISQKKFYANPKVAMMVQTVMDLDPFPDKTIEEKGLMESQGLATKLDIVLSNYISDFVTQLLEEDAKFITKTKQQKREALLNLAKKKVEELSTTKQVATDFLATQGAINGSN